MPTTSKSKSEPWEGAQPALHQGISLLTNAVDADPTGAKSYAAQSKYTKEAQGDLISFARDPNAMQDTKAVQASAMDIVNNGGQNDAIFNNIFSSINPAVQAQFGSAGRVGSGAHQDTITRALTESYAPQASSNYFNAASMVPGLEQAVAADTVDRASILGTVGAQQEAYKQQKLDAPYLQADRLLRAGGQVGGLGGTSSQSSGGVGNALQVLGLGASLFSDRRVKENIKHVGETHGGQKIYTYNYVGDNKAQMGVMADETPTAAVSHFGGVAMVDYSRVA